MALNTTTRRYRNTAKIESAKKAAQMLGMYQPTILEVGPGAILELFANRITEQTHDNPKLIGRLKYGILKAAETALRRTDLFNLYSPEPFEVYEIFQDMRPRITVLDLEQKVINSISQTASQRGIESNFGFIVHDVNKPIPLSADVILAYNMLVRVRDPKLGLRNLKNCLKQGGIISTEEPLHEEDLEQIAPNVYIKTSK